MKAEIMKDGCLHIICETTAEYFALCYMFPLDQVIDIKKIIFDGSLGIDRKNEQKEAPTRKARASI